MVGIRKFDEEATLNAVMELFWRQGYASTSIEDIEQATGVKRGSLYNAYGNKDELFLLALERYAVKFDAPLLAALDEADIWSAMLSLLDAQLAGLSDETRPPSCLIANSSAETPCLEGRIGEALRQQLMASEAVILDRLKKAQSHGQLKPDSNLEALAHYISAIIRIVPLTARATGNLRVAQDVASVALDDVLTRHIQT